MDRCQLATLVKWAGTIKTRKRLQKVVYLLQAAGCDLDVEYTLHHYGPYSQDVASLTDKMVQAGLLCEEKTANSIAGTGTSFSYSYQLTKKAQEQLERPEEVGSIQKRLGRLDQFKPLARRLLNQSTLQKLEFGATVAYLHAKKPDAGWEEARKTAATFKHQDADSATMQDAEIFARQILEQENPDRCPQR